MTDYKTLIEMNSSTELLFEAISKKLGDWWGNQDKVIEKKGTIFTVSWGEPWYKFEVLDYSENQEMIWKCVDANQKIDGLMGIEKEWVGTLIHWKIKSIENGKSLLIFKHEGLVPDFICFEFCSKSWDHFLQDRLVKYLEQYKLSATR